MEYRVKYKPADMDQWTGRTDDLKDRDSFRWHQIIRPLMLDEEFSPPASGKIHFCFLGFCCDRGISNNHGRTGSAAGPLSIRKQMCNLPVNFPEEIKLWDAGDIYYCGRNLEKAQKRLTQEVERIMGAGFFPIVLGGGHELAYGHYTGLLNSMKEPPGIVNMDAHFDLRPYSSEASSGTMFRQIYDDLLTRKEQFSYLCLGIQSCANTKALFRTAEETGTEYLMAMDIKNSPITSLSKKLTAFIDRNSSIYMTLCADVISSAFAPGVSAPQPFGLDPETVVTIVKQVAATGKLKAFDIAEVSPRFDSDNITSRLAAVIIFALINAMADIPGEYYKHRLDTKNVQG